VSAAAVLVLALFGTAIWLEVRRKKWRVVRRLVFSLLLVAVLWVLVGRYWAAYPQG
jgi:hypothetical protein